MTTEQKMIAIGDEALLKLLTNNICRVTIANRMPCGYNFTIFAAAVVFHYREGGQYQQVNTNLNLTCNQQHDFYNTPDSDKCVGLIEVILRVRQNDTGEITNLMDNNPGKPGHCTTDIEFGIRQKGFHEQTQIIDKMSDVGKPYLYKVTV